LCGVGWITIGAAASLAMISPRASDLFILPCEMATLCSPFCGLAAIAVGPRRGQATLALAVEIASWAAMLRLLPPMP